MNLNCKAIFNINIVNFLIFYVAIEFSKNHIEFFFLISNKLTINF
jgi:hypothetical protein